MSDPRPKRQARLLILEHIVRWGTVVCYEDGFALRPKPDDCFNGVGESMPGDLVSLRAAPYSKWYLSWVHEVELLPGGDRRYLLESIEDGALCNWTNTSLVHYNRATVAEHPQWRWTDRQHDFSRRWQRVCFRDCDAHIYKPLPALFDGLQVTLGTRTAYGLGPERPERVFPDWRKVTKAAMRACYLECSAEAEAIREAARKPPETPCSTT